MKLSEWVSASGGRIVVARQLGVTPSAVHYWLQGAVSPRIYTMLKIVKLSKGKVSIEEIIAETNPQAKKKKAR